MSKVHHLERRTDNIPDRVEIFFKSRNAKGLSFPLVFIADIVQCEPQSLRPAFSVLRRRGWDVAVTHDHVEHRRYYSMSPTHNRVRFSIR